MGLFVYLFFICFFIIGFIVFKKIIRGRKMIGVIVCGNIIFFIYYVLGINVIIKGFM